MSNSSDLRNGKNKQEYTHSMFLEAGVQLHLFWATKPSFPYACHSSALIDTLYYVSPLLYWEGTFAYFKSNS